MDYYLGSIELFPYDFVPSGWMLCNGNILSIAPYMPLFALIGNKFGGDGRTTFAVPNLLNTSPVTGMEYYICSMGIYPVRN
jgi:microcystin-dependent protein